VSLYYANQLSSGSHFCDECTVLKAQLLQLCQFLPCWNESKLFTLSHTWISVCCDRTTMALITHWCTRVGMMTSTQRNACIMNRPPSHAVRCIRFPQYAMKMAKIPWKIPLDAISQSKSKITSFYCLFLHPIDLDAWKINFLVKMGQIGL
jgi:hypothetical protein